MRKLLLLPSVLMPLQLSDVCRTWCTLTRSTRLGSYTTYSMPPSKKVSAMLSYLYQSLRSLLSQGPAVLTMRVRPRDTTHSRMTPLWLALQLVACTHVSGQGRSSSGGLRQSGIGRELQAVGPYCECELGVGSRCSPAQQ
jgi:hypothetical protein